VTNVHHDCAAPIERALDKVRVLAPPDVFMTFGWQPPFDSGRKRNTMAIVSCFANPPEQSRHLRRSRSCFRPRGALMSVAAFTAMEIKPCAADWHPGPLSPDVSRSARWSAAPQQLQRMRTSPSSAISVSLQIRSVPTSIAERTDGSMPALSMRH